MSMPNIQDYLTKKEKGLISIQRIDDNNFAIGTRKFDPTDGTELAQEVAGVTIKEIDGAITVKTAETAELEAFKKDLLAAE